MSLATLHDLWVHELKDLYSAERQLVQALPKLAKNATSDELRTAIENHLAETEEHVSRIEEILESFDESPKGQKCHGMEGLIDEGKGLLEEDIDPEVLDAGIIAAAQKCEHYEIASYGAVCEYARVMGHAEALALLEKTLEEEKNADQLLNQLAEGGINALAQRDASARDDHEGEGEEESTEKGKGSANGKGRKMSAPKSAVRAGTRSRAPKARR